mgnify:CR=1 FL=1
MPDQTTPKPSAAALAGILAFLAGVDALVNPGRSAEGDATADSADAEPREQTRTFATAEETRAAFLSDNRELIEEKAVAIVVLSPRGDGDVQASVMSLPGMCAFEQAAALRAVSDSIAANHSAADCARRRADARAAN